MNHAEKIEMVDISKLKPYAKNSRTHSPEQVLQIAESIKEFGFTNPVLIDGKGEIIAGHGRVMGASSLGIKKLPCIRIGYLTEAQRRAYVIADNKIALNAGWDDAVLAQELRELGSDGFNMELTGFNASEIDQLLAKLDATPEGQTDEDETPEIPESPVTKPGDVWILGKHRIICGSSTDAATVDKVLNGQNPHLMVTDPPYGIEYDANWRNQSIRAYNRAIGKVLNDDQADWREAFALFHGDVAYIWHAGIRSNEVADSLFACNFEIRAQIIWAKNNLVIGRGHYHPKHEPCWYAVKKGSTGHWNGDRKQTTVWEINKPHKSEFGHSTQKPVECMKRPIENNSVPGDLIYEPFSGSGTTIIAAEMTGRACFAIELNPAYVDVAVKRWQAYTGKTATLEGDGRTFDELLSSVS